MNPAAPLPADLPTEPPAAGAKPVHKRYVKNYLLDTGLQLRLASYLIAVATILSASLGYLLWRAWRETSQVIELADPEVGATLAGLLAQEDRVRVIGVAITLVAVLLCLLGAAVVITHRIAGPAYAIARTCRQVAEGNLAEPRPLRSRDLLVELGHDVAAMVAALRAQEEREQAVVRAAAERLRSPTATEAERLAAAAELDALAAEKGRRLAP